MRLNPTITWEEAIDLIPEGSTVLWKGQKCELEEYMAGFGKLREIGEVNSSDGKARWVHLILRENGITTKVWVPWNEITQV